MTMLMPNYDGGDDVNYDDDHNGIDDDVDA
jgi:hypothetical protein